MINLKTTSLIMGIALATFAGACAGDDGTDGTNGGNGDNGGDGTDGMNGGDGTNGNNGSNGFPGRPAISTATLDTFNGDDASKGVSKDAYNAARPSEWPSFEGQIAGGLAILDALDGNCGNQLLAAVPLDSDRYAGLAGILADDQLYVNSMSGTCGVYLGLEAEVVGALPAGDGGCGGRMPADDIIDRSYSVLAAGVLTGVDDTITADDCSFSATFPFLCAPNS